MLSSSADSIYWMARYIERAGNTARLLHVNSLFLIDARINNLSQNSYWLSVLEATSLIEEYNHYSGKEDYKNDITTFLALENETASSIKSSIRLARENARMVRDQISDEIWVELNALHLYLNSNKSKLDFKKSLHDFCVKIIQFSLLFEGIANATLPHNEAWNFYQMGMFLERADKTSRIIDIPKRLKKSDQPSSWGAILESCSARSAYRQLYGTAANERSVTDLLIFSRSFPRSIRFCIDRLDENIHEYSGTPKHMYSSEAERIVGATKSKLDFERLENVFSTGLGIYIDKLQKDFNKIGKEIFDAFVLMPNEIQRVGLDESQARRMQNQFSQ